MDIPDQLQPAGKPVRILQTGQKQKAVNLPHLILFLIYGTDFPGHHKTRPAIIRSRCVMDPVLILQRVQTILRRLQLFLQLLPPCRMGEIAGPHNIDSLFPGP